jgi:hypothetical protein
MILKKNFRVAIIAVCLFVVAGSCKKTTTGIAGPPYSTVNSVTLFKPDNISADLKATDTVTSQSGLNVKFIPVSGAVGAAAGLGSIKIELKLAENDVLLSSKIITKFSRPDYHVLSSEPIDIPKAERGKLYKIFVTVTDLASAVVGTKSFVGLDVLTCDPQPSCIVPGQITFLIETPATTLPEDNIYLFGGFNGWANTDQTYKLTKNPDVPNCYCISMPFPPGAAAWQIGEIYITRGSWGTNAVSPDGTQTYIADYNGGDLGPLFKMKVPRWRDR